MEEADKMMTFYRQKNFTDITIKVKEKSIRAHKILLAEKSSVWQQQLLADENQNVLELEDLEFETLEKILNFIYKGQLTEKDLKNNVKDLLAAADLVGYLLVCETVTNSLPILVQNR